MARVKSPVSLTRRERAVQTRARIVATAYRLFCARGWEGTTMQLVADEAGVAVQTMYFTFGNKANLLGEVQRHAVLGDTPRREFFAQWGARLASGTHAPTLISAFVATDVQVKRRLAPLVAALGNALPSDPASVAGREDGRDHFFSSFVHRLAQLGALRGDVTEERAIDIIRVVNTQAAHSDLTLRRGWTEADWVDWMESLLTEQLLSPAAKGEQRDQEPADCET